MGHGIAVCGSINMDVVVPVVALPMPGETILGSTAALHPGGKGANQAVAAARLGARVRLAAAMGHGLGFAGLLEKALQQEGLDLRWLRRVDAAEGMALIAVAADGRNMIIVSPGANGCFTPDLLDDRFFHGMTAVLLQLEIPFDTVRRAAELGRAAGALVCLNAAPAAVEAPVGCCDWLVVNEHEGALLLHRPPIESIADALEAARLLQQRIAGVVITMGHWGAVYAFGAVVVHVPGFTVPVVDTTAAGDTFAAAFVHALSEGAAPEQAVRWANAAGALTCTRHGAQSALPTCAEVSTLFHDAVPNACC